ncbi:hypothetical protein ACFLXQ_03250 [Chloroflexota bacterium]
MSEKPKLNILPAALPLEDAVRIELQQGVPIFRASTSVQERIEMLLHKQQNSEVTELEKQELAQFEEIDDYLSFVNRVVRNLIQTQQQDG